MKSVILVQPHQFDTLVVHVYYILLCKCYMYDIILGLPGFQVTNKFCHDYHDIITYMCEHRVCVTLFNQDLIMNSKKYYEP